MALYPKLQAKSLGAVRKYGLVVTVLKSGGYSGPQNDPVFLPPTRLDVSAIRSNLSKEDMKDEAVANSVMVLILPSEPQVDKENDKVEVSGVEYTIAERSVVSPGGVDILQKVYLVQ